MRARSREARRHDRVIEVEIPGAATLRLEHLVLDYNGTLAVDGGLLPGVKDTLAALSSRLEIHVVTADTFGRARDELAGLPARLSVLPGADQDRAKLEYVERLGCSSVVAIGNGRNDALMLRQSALSIVVVQAEGAAGDSVTAAMIVGTSITNALELLLHPKRLIATLRR